ncbi:general substrate transporter [Trichoderma austrokoningii]
MNQSEKPEVILDDNAAAEDTTKDDTYGLVKSRFDELSIPRTLWVFRRVVLVSLAVYTGYVCEAFELGAGGSVVANAGFIKQFGSVKGEGSYQPRVLFWVADKFGRKVSFYIAWIWLIIGCVLLNTAKTPAVWAIAKLCNGAGIGVLQITCQVYVMEICPNKIRGGLVTFQAVWSNIGGIIVSVMMQQLNKKHPDNYLLAMRIIWAPVALMIVCWIFIPESPWFYARHEDKGKAIKSLKQLYGGVEGFDFEEEYGIIVRTITHEREVLQEAPQYRHVFKGLNLKRAFIVVILSVSQQFAGLAIINTYSTCACCNLLAVLLWSLSTDKLGRRTIVNSCETLVCVVLFVVGGLFWTGATSGNAAAGTALLVDIDAVKTGPITFFFNSITGIATCYATPPMLLHLSLKAGFVYGAFSVPICIIMWLYVPETSGRSAAEIDELYERRVPAWRWSTTVTEAEQRMQTVVLVKGGVKGGVKGSDREQ